MIYRIKRWKTVHQMQYKSERPGKYILFYLCNILKVYVLLEVPLMRFQKTILRSSLISSGSNGIMKGIIMVGNELITLHKCSRWWCSEGGRRDRTSECSMPAKEGTLSLGIGHAADFLAHKAGKTCQVQCVSWVLLENKGCYVVVLSPCEVVCECSWGFKL